MVPGPLELRIYNGGSRWLLQPQAVVEVWAGAAFVGMLSGHAVTLIVEHHLAAAALAAAVQREIQAPEPARPDALRRPPQAVIPDAAQRAALRMSRRRRASLPNPGAGPASTAPRGAPRSAKSAI